MIRIRMAQFLLWYGSVCIRVSAALSASIELSARRRLRQLGVPDSILESDSQQNPTVSDKADPTETLRWPPDPTMN